ncbi:tRNA preQ1(34) S-adenosylmethionine ribosyltransferase-isomerase QueA [Oscillospiraceae bacterium MB08-C2-2]|nr:tRNA preQ1(34) S-adenosylmethionine ribosyltransferase-isomerase QueA [Oscillospiraceae bacterium MB08-C2-2]
MKTSDFWYNLPQEQIAQQPLEPRDSSRLMVMERSSGQCSHKFFRDLSELLAPGDLLVLNDSRVLPARLFGTKEGSGGSMQFLLLEQKSADCWEILVKPGKRAKPGARFIFGEGLLVGEILEVLEGGNRLARFEWQGDFFQVLDQIGQMPLPEYITQRLTDKERYQTVYAREPGSAAAPTAGLHFTPRLLEELKNMQVDIAFTTLHVGLGTFRPVKETEITNHKMHSEHYSLSAQAAEQINAAKARGGRVIAVGTTSCRTLESVFAKEGRITASEGYTDIFLYPGCTFGVLDGLITNFHLPESTLIMLVSAFAGYDNTMAAYRLAVEENYRFYSLGDAMAIL